jgi:alpha-beta hydrolase superfamily lysophospholipase
MRLRITPVVAGLLKSVAHALAGALAVALIAAVYVLDSRPDLSVWHLANLDEEFTANADVANFEAYLRLEDRLFEQLEREVIAKVPRGPQESLNRFSAGSASDPGRWPRNWNRSYELPTENPVAGALLLHGLSDSPYSLRALAERLHAAGVSVLGLRVPGHGTAPAGLVRARWQDMAAAVELAARHLGRGLGDKPLFVVGYSNGGALAVEYTLSTLDDTGLPRPAGIVLFSPEIGVTRLAFLAAWQSRLGHLLGLEKLAWSSIEPEYDPFKYNSFAINAGDLAYRITGRIQEHLGTLEKAGKLGDMPPLLAFQSSVDATVSAPALVEHLFDRLGTPDHELVLFDVNRDPAVESLLAKDPRTVFDPLLARPERGFKLTVITNEREGSARVVARTRAHGEGRERERRVELEARWPQDVYSVGHLALPFSPLDPLYGGPQAPASPGVALGHVALRGESGVLRVSAKSLLRMHWNPFYDYVESQVLAFMGLTGANAR